MKSNITILALNKKLTNKIAKNLSTKLDMFFVDANELVKYDLLDINKVIKVAGIDYYNKAETKIIKSISCYENVIITIDNDTLFNNNNFELLKQSSLFIYIKINYLDFVSLLKKSKNKNNKYEIMIDKKVYHERDMILTKLSDITVRINNNTKDIEGKIINKIKKFYKGVL